MSIIPTQTAVSLYINMLQSAILTWRQRNQRDGSTTSATYSAVLRRGKQTDVNIDVMFLRYLSWRNATRDANLL